MDIDDQPRKRIVPATSKEITKISTLCLNLLGHLGLHIGRHAEEVRHDLVALLLAGVLNLLEFDFGLLVGIIFGLLKSARVLEIQVNMVHSDSLGGISHLSLELLVLFFLLTLVFLDFLLGLCLGVPYPLCAVCIVARWSAWSNE